MRYMILIGHDEVGGKELAPDERGKLFGAYQKYHADLRAAGVLLSSAPLKGSQSGARLTTDNGKRVVKDGPFSESKEIIGGYFLIEARTREEAAEWTARCPAAQLGPWSYAELREVEEIPVQK
jgi:hypothetical protein